MTTIAPTPSSAPPARRLLPELLDSEREGVVDRAASAVLQLRRSHYETADCGETRRRLGRLYDAVVTAATRRNLGPVVEYAQRLAEERYGTGHTLPELQAAFNALEEALWEQLVADLPADEIADALTLISAIFGVAKDTLACAYVVAATRTREQTLALGALAAGVGSA